MANFVKVKNPFPIAIPSVASIFDDAEDIFSLPLKKKVVFEFAEDPLYAVLAWIEKGYGLSDIHNALSKIDDFNLPLTVTDQHKEEAERIRQYFRNRLIMRRLKSQHISPFMESLDKILESPTRLESDAVKILVKLPDFYKEGIETDDLFKQFKSAEESRKSIISGNFEIEYVRTIVRKDKGGVRNRRYFKTENNNLLLVENSVKTPDDKLWNYIISQNKKIGVKGSLQAMPQPGYDFVILREHFIELYNLDN